MFAHDGSARYGLLEATVRDADDQRLVVEVVLLAMDLTGDGGSTFSFVFGCAEAHIRSSERPHAAASARPLLEERRSRQRQIGRPLEETRCKDSSALKHTRGS